MKKKTTEEATLESLRKIEENTRKTVERLDRLEKTSRLAPALTSLTILLAMFMPVFTLSIILRGSFLGDLLFIVALGMGISLIVALWILNKALNKIIKAKREST